MKTDPKLKRLSLNKQTLCLLDAPVVPRAGEEAYTRVVCHSYVGC